MGGWLNFSSDHVEPIKADHGTSTSNLFHFFRSLFISAPRAGLYPPPSPTQKREREKESTCSLSPMRLPSRSGLAVPPPPPPLSRPRASSSSFHLVFLLLPRPLTHSGNSLDFFASRGGVIYLAEVERHPRRWSTKRARGWVGNARAGYEGDRGRIGGGGRGEAA